MTAKKMADAYAAACNEHHWNPSSTSPVTRAIQAAPEGTLRDARQELSAHAATSFGVALDNIKGMARLLDDCEVVFAVAAQARAVMENAALSFHFCEPDVSALDALIRVSNAELVGIHQTRLVAERLPDPQRSPQLAMLAERNDQTTRRLSENGLKISSPKQHWTQPTVADHVPPSIGALVAAVTEPDRLGRNAYSHLSAVAHGHMHGLTEYVTVTEWDEGPLARGNVEVSPQQEARAYGTALLTTKRAADRLFGQFGWSQDTVALPASIALQVWADIGGWA